MNDCILNQQTIFHPANTLADFLFALNVLQCLLKYQISIVWWPSFQFAKAYSFWRKSWRTEAVPLLSLDLTCSFLRNWHVPDSLFGSTCLRQNIRNATFKNIRSIIIKISHIVNSFCLICYLLGNYHKCYTTTR